MRLLPLWSGAGHIAWTLYFCPLFIIMNSPLEASLWNVRGMGDLFKGRAVRKWINRFHTNLDVICLQELKAHKEKLAFQLSTLFLRAPLKWITHHRVELELRLEFCPI